MTTNMRNAIEQAAYEVGLATAKYNMLIAGIEGTMTLGQAGVVVKTITLTKAAKDNAPLPPVNPKAPTIARGIKKPRKAAGPRTKGVKEAIMNLINSEPMTIDQIVEHTGFKVTSVRATLMALKNSGIASPDENKVWYGSPEQFQNRHGNSDHDAAQADY